MLCLNKKQQQQQNGNKLLNNDVVSTKKIKNYDLGNELMSLFTEA